MIISYSEVKIKCKPLVGITNIGLKVEVFSTIPKKIFYYGLMKVIIVELFPWKKEEMLKEYFKDYLKESNILKMELEKLKVLIMYLCIQIF